MEMLVHSGRARVLSHAGFTAEAEEDWNDWLDLSRRQEGELSSTSALWQLDDLLGEMASDAPLREFYAGWASDDDDRLGFHGIGLDHLRGDIALHFGDIPAARRHYQTGIDWALTQGAHMEHAQCLHGFAKLAEAEGKPGEAVAYLDQALELFSRYGIRYFERKCLEMRARLAT